MNLHVVTCSLDKEKTKGYWRSWEARQGGAVTYHHVEGILGVGTAFAKGCLAAVAGGADIIACFHDDLRIDEDGWDLKVVRHFETHPRTGVAGFFGAKSLGAGDIYTSPYSPTQLARGGCGSDMEDAELHGERWAEEKRVVCHDGFSLIGRAGLITGAWKEIEGLGIKMHVYDVLLGALSIEAGWENWYIPMKCKHAGGMSSVASEKYQEWANRVNEKGDRGIWEEAHQVAYERLRGVLPVWVEE